jgi:ribosomal protein S18 acetylase RimI-like enzyme
MIETKTYNTGPAPGTILLLGLVVILVAIAGFSYIEKPIGNSVYRGSELETVYSPTFNLSVMANGNVEISLPTDSTDMPDCKDLGIEGCNWEAKLQRGVDGSNSVIDTTLVRDGQVVGRVQVLEIETGSTDYELLETVAEMGHERAWISHVQVLESYRGQGLGRTLWHASDAMIKTLVGPGQAVHILVDQAGWGEALMRDINPADIIARGADYWVYVIR